LENVAGQFALRPLPLSKTPIGWVTMILFTKRSRRKRKWTRYEEERLAKKMALAAGEVREAMEEGVKGGWFYAKDDVDGKRAADCRRGHRLAQWLAALRLPRRRRKLAATWRGSAAPCTLRSQPFSKPLVSANPQCVVDPSCQRSPRIQWQRLGFRSQP
jgi:hypothetical protein